MNAITLTTPDNPVNASLVSVAEAQFLKSLGALVSFNQFLIYQLVPNGAKTHKYPCSLDGKRVDAHDSTHHVSASEAWREADKRGAGWGVGFVFTEADPFFFLDVDGALRDGEWNPIAKELCQLFAGAFVEVSQSRTGLHLIGTGSPTLPTDQRRKKARDAATGSKDDLFDLYTEGRFCALTCIEASGDTGSAHHQAALDYIVEKWLKDDATGPQSVNWTTTHQPESTGHTLSDDDLIDKALASKSVGAAFGFKASFADLWHVNAEKLAEVFPPDQDVDGFDRSAADAALASHLIWWTGGNCSRVDLLMRRSGLARDKYDRPDYMQRTICGVAARATSYYNVVKPDAEAAATALCAATLPTTSSAKIEPLATLDVRPVQMTGDHIFDAGIIMKSVFADRIGSFEGAAHWWNGQCWEFAPDDLLRRAVGVAMMDANIKTTRSRIEGTFAVMRDQLPRFGQIDPPSRVVFFNNGALDVHTGAVTAHNAAHRNSRVIPVDYDPSATCPEWQAWLADIFRNEPERATLLQEMIGWTLCRDHLGIEKALMLIGPGRSGKGTIIRVLRALLGNGAGAFTLPTLDDNKALAGMRGQNVTIDSDAASPARTNARQIVGLFKAISSNEPVPVKLLYTQMPWQGALNCKLMLAANSIPTMWDDSAASANRWIPLVFDRSFLGNEDVTLADRLTNELQGIAAWAVLGLQRLAKTGRFTMPQSTRDELANMVISGSPIEQFITDRLSLGMTKAHRVTETDLWTGYRAWCSTQGHEEMKRRDFLKALEDALRGKGAKRKTNMRIGDKVAPGFDGVSYNTVMIDAHSAVVVQFR